MNIKEQVQQEDLVGKFAILLEKMQAPVSMSSDLAVGKELFSEIGPIFDQIRDDVNVFGWKDKEEIEQALRNYLQE